MKQISLKSLAVCLLAALTLGSTIAASPSKEAAHGTKRLWVAPIASERPCVRVPRESANSIARSTETDLASRVSAALLGVPKPARRRSAAAPAKRGTRWVCGAWTELWQGSGRGRSCEWREAPASVRDARAAN